MLNTADHLHTRNMGKSAPMLTQLTIKGLAIIENLSIEFSNHLNVITGETGAGKSILIKALGLVTGSKASADVVRKGFDAAQVTASFHLPKLHRACEVLRELGLPLSQDNTGEDLIVRRQISAKGRSQVWVNDTPVSLTALKLLGDALIDIFAQHENHRLLDPQLHLHYLDKFLAKADTLSSYEQAFDDAQQQMKAIYALTERYQQRARERDYIAFRLDELRELDPSQLDFEELSNYCERAGRAVDETKVIDEVQQLLDAGFQNKPLSQALREIIKRLEKMKRPESDTVIADLVSTGKDVEAQLNDMSYGLGKLMVDLDFDESQLDQCQERLGAYKDLCRKLGVQDVDSLIVERDRLEEEIGFLESAESELIERMAKLARHCRNLTKLAEQLSQERVQAFKNIQSSIGRELEQLDMKGAILDAEFLPVQQSLSALDLSDFDLKAQELWLEIVERLTKLNRFGQEKVQFLLAANPGEPAKPLAKVASGGELSRIMLGIKKVLSVGADTCVMVFDEIDTGISGKTANIVGAKLRDFAQNFQVICISHLAQVAAFGDSHFKVEKSLNKGRTESHIYRLDQQQSAEEIARLLSGEEITAPSLAHAKQLIAKAREPYDKLLKLPSAGKKLSSVARARD
ncbi:MAG: DNA repair protein RecN [Oligoflexus sp.]